MVYIDGAAGKNAAYFHLNGETGMSQRDRKATILDVARRANVSPATVSRAINHPGKVKDSTYMQIAAAMEALGYGPQVRASHKKVILIILPDLENTFYSGVLEGIFAAAERSDYHFLLRQSAYGRSPSVETIRDICASISAAGVIFMNAVSEETLRSLSETLAVVQCCECNKNSAFSYVTIDDHRAALTAVKYLISRGRRRIAFINNQQGFKYAAERLRGYEDALRTAGLEANPSWMLSLGDFRYESVASVVTKMFMSKGEHPDAIFAVSDTYGAAAIRAVKQRGLRVPEDVSVVGFDNTFLCKLCDPPLTTVVQPRFQLGNMACEILIEAIENPAMAPRQVVLDTEFVIRGSA